MGRKVKLPLFVPALGCLSPLLSQIAVGWIPSGPEHGCFLGANDPYKSLKTTLKAEINEDAWATLNSDTSRSFGEPKNGRIAVKVTNHLDDEMMKVFRVE